MDGKLDLLPKSRKQLPKASWNALLKERGRSRAAIFNLALGGLPLASSGHLLPQEDSPPVIGPWASRRRKSLDEGQDGSRG